MCVGCIFMQNKSKMYLLFYYLLLNRYNFAHHLPCLSRKATEKKTKIKISLQIYINFGKLVGKEPRRKTLPQNCLHCVVSTLKLILIHMQYTARKREKGAHYFVSQSNANENHKSNASTVRYLPNSDGYFCFENFMMFFGLHSS